MPHPHDLPSATLAEVVSALESFYDPRDAESWDAVGLVCGDPASAVRRVLFAVDPVAEVVDEALGLAADLVVTHHPLLLSAVHAVPASDPRGAVIHRLVRAGAALFTAHTNADVASPGVSDALAQALGLVGLRPLVPLPAEGLDSLVTHVPAGSADELLDALTAAGAVSAGQVARVGEARLELVVPRGSRSAVLAALRAAHPYETPSFTLTELVAEPGPKGLGRVGSLPEPMPLEEFLRLVGAALPPTAWGVRATGDPARVVRTVAVCGGSGGSAIADARRAGADAYVTADLRHHVASDAVADGGPALVDAAHWATEWPWLADAAARLRDSLANVECVVSTICTDPWTLALPAFRPRSSAHE